MTSSKIVDLCNFYSVLHKIMHILCNRLAKLKNIGNYIPVYLKTIMSASCEK